MIGEITAISLEHDLKFTDANSVEGNLIVSGSYKLTEASRIEESFSYKLPTDIILTECLDLDTTHIDIEDFYYEIENDYNLICYIDIKIEGVEIVDIEEEKPVEEVITETFEELDEIEKLADVEELPTLQDEPPKVETIETSSNRECDGEPEELQEKTEEMEIEKMELEKNTIEKSKIENTEIEKLIENKEAKVQSQSVSSLFENINESEETYATYSVYILREEETINSLIEKYKTTKEELESYNDVSALSVGSKIIIPYHAQDN